MTRSIFCTFVCLALTAGALVVAPSALPVTTESVSSAASAAGSNSCAGPCPTIIFGLGSGSGGVDIVLEMKSGERQVISCYLGARGQCAEAIEEGFLTAAAYLRPVESTGSQFLRWLGCPNPVRESDSACPLRVGEAATLCAVFRLRTDPSSQETICPPPNVYMYKKGDGEGTVTVNGPVMGSKSCGPACKFEVSQRSGGEEIRLEAAPSAGSAFVRWDGCPSGPVGTCTTTVAGAVTVCAVFVRTGSAAPSDPACPYSSPKPRDLPPKTTLTAGPSATRATRSRRATFRFRSNEAGSTFLCRLDSRPWLPCRSPKTYTNLKPGAHTFRVRAIDRGGKLDPTPATRRWRIRR